MRTVAREHMLDDGETQSGAAGFPRTAAVHAIKPLGEARNMLGSNAFAGIAHGKHAFAIAQLPGKGDVAALGCVAHGIGNKITQRTADFLQTAAYIGIAGDVEADTVAAATQRFGFGRQHPCQLGHSNHFILQVVVGTFQPRQREQIVQQMLHAPGVVEHQIKIAARLAGGQRRRIGQGFNEATYNGERCAQLVRDIGDEVATDGVNAFQLGDVARNQQFFAFAKRHQLYGQGDFPIQRRFAHQTA